MEKPNRVLGVVGALALFLVAAPAKAGAAGDGPPVATPRQEEPTAVRVRSHSARISAFVDEMAMASPTFRGLLGGIQATDGIVFVEEGACPNARKACLLLAVAGSPGHRVLRVHVSLDRADDLTVAAIAHELHHALEVLSNPRLTTGSAMYLFYRVAGARLGAKEFETREAVAAGRVVMEEVGRSKSAHGVSVVR